jgi:hypothetical protein
MDKTKLFGLLLLFFLSLPVSTQSRPPGFPKPPEPAERNSTDEAPKPRRAHTDAIDLQREAKELLELSQSLQLDIVQVNHGLLPKDTLEKLKRIEKLSKHLRGELTQ